MLLPYISLRFIYGSNTHTMGRVATLKNVDGVLTAANEEDVHKVTFDYDKGSPP